MLVTKFPKDDFQVYTNLKRSPLIHSERVETINLCNLCFKAADR